MSIKAFFAAAGLVVATAAIVPAAVSAQGMHRDDHRGPGGPMVRHDNRRDMRHNMRRRPVCRVTWVHHRKVRRCR
ncbi:hypothetical protein Q4F19_05450 [Sphingomonas sp. BIUV-7]|uniref:Uncharacterized protein n=1 Tax=Sphingomonas natans TaxID=3063330 RepID=A0ABT8Y7V9_9SPHN|nr:hypothetical protein [Sphingomonas sp. BIUV-7]MDO6413819.1 hypothetical protein [Sphingomonas sp. BIUV-7]